MSIIYDALKKVEASSVNHAKTKIDKGLKSRPKAYLLYILIVCICLSIANAFYGWLSRNKPSPSNADISTLSRPLTDKKEPAPSNHNMSTPALPKTLPIDTETEPRKESPPVFTLNGVFFSGSEGYALINNRIARKGDKIDGATVVQVSLDGVDLQLEGVSIKLSNNAK